MMRYKQNNSYQPTEELEHKTLLSDPPETPKDESDALPKKGRKGLTSALLILLIVMVAVLTLGYGYFTSPQGDPTPVEYQMYAKEILPNGNVIEKGTFHLSGELLRYPGGFKGDRLQIDELDIMDETFKKNSLRYSTDNTKGHIVLNSGSYIIEISPEGDWCVIHTEYSYYVCSTNENFDTKEILELCIHKPA